MSIAEQVRPEQRFLLRGISWSTYEMVRFLECRNESDETTWLAMFQDWVRANFADQRRETSSHGPS